MRASLWFAMLPPATLFLAAVAIADPTSIGSGPMRCGINGYMWPLSGDSAPIAADTGTMEIVSDGRGNYTSGQMTEHLGDDTHIAGTDVCTFDLVNGTYLQQSDGTTVNTTTWRLRPGSDSHCGVVSTHSKVQGFIAGARDFREFQRTSTSYVLEDGRIVWVAASKQGVAIGACQAAQE